MFDIITDSACDLTLDTAKQLQIEVVPFYVSLDGEHYRKEGKEIAVRDFYQFMVDNPSAYPKTSLASIEDFEQAFRAHAAAGRDVLCLVFTSKMSGCVGSARNARDLVLEDFPDARIEVIDSAAATVTESTMVENAVAMRDAGCTLDEIHLFFQKADITGGNAVPGCSHCCYIVKHMAFRFLHGSKVRNNFFRFHNNLAQKNNTRADDLSDHTHHTDDGVNLFQVTARSSQLFPDIRNRVNTDHIHSLVCKEEEVVHHLIENTGISVVQIPLIRIKCCHHLMTGFRKILSFFFSLFSIFFCSFL